jgi:tetratricopeptide (TPR) repeat protein
VSAERDLQALRHEGYRLQSEGRNAEAAARYEKVVARAPGDWEIWNNLGNARRAAGDRAGAVAALSEARNLRGGEPAIHFNLAVALTEAGRAEAADAAFAEAVRLTPDHADALLGLGRALSALGRYEEADAAYRRAPGATAAWFERGQLLERGNRLDRLSALIAEAAQAGVRLAYLNALALEREGRAAEALEEAKAMPARDDPVRRALLIGRLSDRAGDAAGAFAAYVEMNRIVAAAHPGAGAAAAAYRRHVAALAEMLTPAYAAGWIPAPAGERPAPVFLVGFPRSGTTLIDTLLMGHRHVHVLEEEPLLQRAGEALGDFARLPGLDAEETEGLRAHYFAALDARDPPPGKLVVDKLPLNILGAPLIHRLFPQAKLIFAERHPCDVVLSCFMQNFDLNDAMANFLDLEDAARLYDLVLRFWTKAREVLPLDVHVLRYEALVADKEAEMRALVAFLGLRWDDKALDNEGTAIARGLIATPSYAQVAQPIYARASGRWTRYRHQLADVLPILAPWADKLGYEL